MLIADVRLYPIALPLVERLGTSFGNESFKTAILVKVTTDAGVVGWGEVSAELNPGYSSETLGTALHMLQEFLVPRMLNQPVEHPTDVPALLRAVRGHPLAKHGLEAAVWDAWARHHNLPLAQTFAEALARVGGANVSPCDHIVVGVSIGIQPSINETLAIIEKRRDQGYERIKLKIKPGWDVALAKAVRAAMPDITLMLDANSAYTLADADHLRHLDDFGLLMLEQPLGHDDIYQHSKLQPHLDTPICLDESLLTVDDVALALELGACRIVNLKPARVGGYTEALRIVALCARQRVPLWIGGLLETGVGRAANLAFASLPAVTLPSDISATDRYFAPDLADPPFTVRADSTIATPTGPGTGVDVQHDRLEEAVRRAYGTLPYKRYGLPAVAEVLA